MMIARNIREIKRDYPGLGFADTIYVYLRGLIGDSNPTHTDTCKYLRTFFLIIPLMILYVFAMVFSVGIFGYMIWQLFIVSWSIPTWEDVLAFLGTIVSLTGAGFLGIGLGHFLTRKVKPHVDFSGLRYNFTGTFWEKIARGLVDWKNRVCTPMVLGKE